MRKFEKQAGSVVLLNDDGLDLYIQGNARDTRQVICGRTSSRQSGRGEREEWGVFEIEQTTSGER